ncbi:MAG: transposase [Segetibacter sp.]
MTICCQDRKCRFGKIVAGEMVLNDFGIIAYDQWLTLTERFTTIELDVFQIMPNHMHGIIIINESTVGATLAVAPDVQNNHNNRAGTSPEYAVATDDVNDLDIKAGAGHVVAGKEAGASPAPTVANETNATIGGIVGAYKSLVANACLNLFKIKNETMGKLWQRNYYEHIIRNEKSYQTISDYIVNNPDKWIDDKFFIHETHHRKQY